MSDAPWDLTTEAACELFTDGRIHAQTLKAIMRTPPEARAALLRGIYAEQDRMAAEFISIREGLEFDETSHAALRNKNKVLHTILVGSPHRTKQECGKYKNQLKGMVLPPGADLMYMEPCGEEIDNAKQACAERALRDGFRWLLLLDDDVYPCHPNWLGFMLEHGLDIVSGVYNIKRNPDMTCSQTYNEQGLRVKVDKTADDILIPAHIVAGGLVLINTVVFHAMARPWFKTSKDRNGKTLITEDVYFSTKCRENGIPMWIDTRVVAQHVDAEKGLIW